MNIVKTNHFSKMHNLYDNATKTDEEFFKHRIDPNTPNFAFKRVDTSADQLRANYSDNKARFTLKQAGFLGKMFIRHTFKYNPDDYTEEELTVIRDSLSPEVGEHIIKKARLMQQEKEIEEITPIIINHRINTQFNNEEINLQDSIKASNDSNGFGLTFYTPLLFSTGSDVNHMLDLKFLQTIKLEVDIENYETLGLEDNIYHDMELLCHYMTIDDYEGYAMKHYKKPLYLPIENSGIIGGAPKNISLGRNTIQLDNRDLVKFLCARVYDNGDIKKESLFIEDVKITSNNEEIYRAKDNLESLLFNNNYRGFVSHRVPQSTDVGLIEVNFDIPAYKNGFSGGLNMDELYKDCNISFNVYQFGGVPSNDLKAVVGYLYYDMLKIDTDGTIQKAEVNNTPFLDEYDYSTEPTKPELPKKEAPPAKVSL